MPALCPFPAHLTNQFALWEHNFSDLSYVTYLTVIV